MVKGEDLLSSTNAVPIARDIATSILYFGQKDEVYVYLSLDALQQKVSFFDNPIEFISTGSEVITYLNSIKFDYSFKELEMKVNDAIEEIKYFYPDVVEEIEQWKTNNLIDFFQDPYGFIQNGYDLENYLKTLSLDIEKEEKLKNIYQQIKFVYPDQARILEKFIN
jgi:hypothetical protein